MLKALVKHQFLILTGLLFLILRLPSLFEPYWYGDEGIYLTLGQGIRKGLTLYTQIHDNKPPTLYYLAALGNTVFGFRLLLFLVMIPTVYFFYRLAKKFLEPKITKLATILFVILTSIPLLEGNIANAEVFMLLPTILGFIIFLNAKKPQNFLVSGLLLGFAFTIKIPVAFEFLFLFVLIFLDKIGLFNNFSFKTIPQKFLHNFPIFLNFAIGFVAPIIFWAIYFYFQKALGVFLNAALLQNFGYLSSWATGSHTNSIGSGGLMIRFVVLLISWVLIYFLYFKKIIVKNTAFILLWFSAAVFSVLLSARPYPHYLIQLVPPLCLILAGLFSSNYRSIKWAFVASILFLGFIILKYKFYFYPVVGYYQNFYSFAFHQKSQSNYYSYFGSNVNQTYAIANYIKSNSTVKQNIFVWGDEPYIYALANRLPSSKYTVAYHIVDFNGYDDTIAKIKSKLPEFIVYYPSDRAFPQLNNLIKRYYYATKAFDSVIIFKLR